MANKRFKTGKNKTMKKNSRKAKKAFSPFSRFSRTQLLLFALVFAGIGGFLLWQTFAASNIVLKAENLDTVRSPGTTKVTETGRGKRSVQVMEVTGGETSRATISKPVAAGKYTACFWGVAQKGSPSGEFSSKEFLTRNGTEPVDADPQPYTATSSTEYKSLACMKDFTHQVGDSNTLAFYITNTVANSVLRVSFVILTTDTPTPPPPPPPPPPPTPTPAGDKPNAGNTGPRITLTRTLSSSDAIAELRRTGKLSGVRITGGLQLNGSDGKGWVIEDSRIEANGASYAVQSYTSTGFSGSKAERPILRYVEIVGSAGNGTGRSSATVYGSSIVLDHADIYGSDDGVKATGNIDVLNSWIHDNDHPEGAHCDGIQIRSGTDILIKGSRIDAYVAYSSDGSTTPDGSPCSGGLQTGSVIGNIQARWENNWFAGGHYTIRGWASRDAAYTINYVFRNNKWMRNGTSVKLNRTNLIPHTYGPITGSLGDFDNSNVWEDTGEPVR